MAITRSTTPGGGKLLYAAAIAVYIVIASWFVDLSRHQINPDGVVYIMVARHYLSGRFDLAVNSYWGPLLSWLLIPAIWLKADPQLAVKILFLLFGLGFGLGVLSVLRALNGEAPLGARGALILLAALLLAANMLPEPITPDLLLACIMSWYFALSIRLVRSASAGAGLAVAVGAVGGLAYLAKAYALPFVAVHLVLTALTSRLAARRTDAPGPALKPFLTSLAAFAVVALPWVITISVQDGHATIGSAGRLTFFAKQEKLRSRSLPVYSRHKLTRPRAGRVTTMENPTEVPAEFRPFDKEPFSWRLGAYLSNIRTLSRLALRILKDADAFGLMMSGWLVTACLLAASRSFRSGLGGPLRLWTCLSILIYVGGYLPVHLRDRYLWPIYGLLLALAVHAYSTLLAGRGAQPADDEGGKSPWLRRVGPWVVPVFLVLSVAWPCWDTADLWRKKSAYTQVFRQAAEQLDVSGQVASNSWGEGLYCSFWNDGVLLGRTYGQSPEDIAAELAPFGGPTRLVIYRDPNLARRLYDSPLFTLISTTDPACRFMCVFEYPPRRPPGR